VDLDRRRARRIFNALVAPVIFHTVIEYPVTLLLACLLIPSESSKAADKRARILDVALPVCSGC